MCCAVLLESHSLADSCSPPSTAAAAASPQSHKDWGLLTYIT